MAEINDLTESLNRAHREINSLKNHMDDCLRRQSEYDRRLLEVEKIAAETKAYAEDLEEYILNLDCATRKRNLVISGLSDEKNEKPDSLLLRVYNFLSQYVETLDYSDMDCAYRLGKYSKSSTRPVLCKFLKEKTRNECYAIRTSLNDDDSSKKIYLNDDLPQLMKERRRDFRTIIKLAKEQKIPASGGLNKITVNNITYTHKNLDCLPSGLTLEDAKVVKVKGGYAFQSEHAWPSNFYPSPIEIEGIPFPTVEHAYHYSRAMRHNDSHSATLILRTKNPKNVKKLSYGIETSRDWDRDKIDIMRHLIGEKFRQNPALSGKLIASGSNNLIEATLDPFWGAKAAPGSKSIKNGTWTGANMLGKILVEATDEIRRELGCPAQPMDTNAPATVEVAANPAHPSEPEATGQAVPSSQECKQTTTTTAALPSNTTVSHGQNSSPVKQSQNQSQQTSAPSRKNKNHQSPIPSTGDSPSDNKEKTKKQRIFSPKSALPPRNFSTLGSLFACPPVNSDPVTATMV